MKKQILSYILMRLFRATSEDNVIYSVCQKTGLRWEDARALVEQVKNEHLAEIEARQIPIKSFLSFVFSIIGIILTVGPVIYLWIMLDFTRTFVVFVSSGTSASAETAIKLLGSRCALLSWFELPSIVFTILVGLGIIGANIQYMREVWTEVFRYWNAID